MHTPQVAGFYAAMMKSDYVKKDVFNKNFMLSWREVPRAYGLFPMMFDVYGVLSGDDVRGAQADQGPHIVRLLSHDCLFNYFIVFIYNYSYC